MLESLRHYARERLDATGLADTSRRLHAQHFATVAAEIAAGFKSPAEAVWRSRLDAELDNFRAAVFWALDSVLDEDRAIAVRTIAELGGAAGAAGWTGVGAWAEQAVGRAESADARYGCLILAAASHNAYFRGDFALARRLAADALRLGVVPGCPSPAIPFIPAFMYAKADDLPHLLSHALTELDRVEASRFEYAHLRSSAVSIAALVGNLALAQAEAGSTLELCREVGSPLCIATALYAYGLAWLQANPVNALATLDDGYAILRDNETTGPRALALVAQLYADNGDIAPAVVALHDAITIANTNGDRAASAVVVARGILVLRCAGAEEEAAVLAGTITNGLLSGLRPLPPHELVDHSALLEVLRRDLGRDRYGAAADRGAGMTYDEIVAFVLHSADSGSSHGDPEEHA